MESKLKEAEVYISMGLLVEAFDVYRKILIENPGIDVSVEKDIKKKIAKIRSDIDNQAAAKGQEASEEDILVEKEGLPDNKHAQKILDAALDCKEMDLYDDAVTEFSKLFQFNYPLEKIIPEITTCLLKSGPSSSFVAKVTKILIDQKLDNQQKSRILFRFCLEMEKNENNDLAISLVESARELDPNNSEIKKKLDFLKTGPLNKDASGDKLRSEKHEENEAVPSEINEKRRAFRVSQDIPEFLTVEFSLGKGEDKENTYNLSVLNYSSNGLGLLIDEKNIDLVQKLRPGDKINDMTFYASWALIKVDVTVRHISEVEDKELEGRYVMGVESNELMESA